MLPYGMKWYLGIFTEGKELDFFVEVVCPLPEFLPLAEMNKNKPSPFAYFSGLAAAFKH